MVDVEKVVATGRKQMYRIWYSVFLAYCMVLLFSLWYNLQSDVIVIPLYLFVPGYASIKLLNFGRGILQQATISIALTLALILLLRFLLESLEISRLVSDVTMLTSFSAICFAYKMVKPV